MNKLTNILYAVLAVFLFSMFLAWIEGNGIRVGNDTQIISIAIVVAGALASPE